MLILSECLNSLTIYFTKGHQVKISNRQSGSVHVIIIIILVVALVGGLGFVFWSNFSKKEMTNSANNVSTDKEDTVESVQSVAPDGWEGRGSLLETDGTTVVFSYAYPVGSDISVNDYDSDEKIRVAYGPSVFIKYENSTWQTYDENYETRELTVRNATDNLVKSLPAGVGEKYHAAYYNNVEKESSRLLLAIDDGIYELELDGIKDEAFLATLAGTIKVGE